MGSENRKLPVYWAGELAKGAPCGGSTAAGPSAPLMPIHLVGTDQATGDNARGAAMQISGRLVILVTVGLALAMSGGAWWYQYQASRQAAAFWGADAARLLVGSEQVVLLELGEPLAEGDGEAVAGRAIAATCELSDKPGLVHLRHAFTQDADFDWTGRRRQLLQDSGPWAYALRFSRGTAALVVLLREDMQEIGKLALSAQGAAEVDVLPCPRLAKPVRQYLADVNSLSGESSAR